MYTAIKDFWSSKGTFFSEGDTITNLRYFFLPRWDKEKFIKGNISKGKTVKPYTQSSEKEREEWRNRVGTYASKRPSPPSNHHYGYGPEPGYSQPSFPTSHYIAVDSDADSPAHHHVPHSSGWDSHDHTPSDYGHSHSDSSSYSSSDSSSCDSGGGDCGGGCDGGGGCD